MKFDMESYYKDSLSTAIANMLLQCGFENSSKRALDEFVGISLSYMKNIVSKISSFTNDCNMVESDIVMGLGSLKLHGYDLDEMFNFLQNYNDIFPPPPKTYFGPIPQKPVKRPHEDKPNEIVSWAPEMSTSLATIGMKLKNKQIVTDPNFDRSKFLALSLKSPTYNSEQKPHNPLSQSTKTTNCAVKYGSNCSYRLPPEAYPNKYEPPTIDLDTNGAVVGLNGKSGKLPDPYINDLEEQDILRQKSKFYDNHSTKLTLPNQLFNGVRRKARSNNNTDNRSCHNSPQPKRRPHTDNLSPTMESPPLIQQHPHVDRSVTSDDVWNAALQAKIITVIKPDPYSMNFDEHSRSVSPLKSFTPTVVVKKQKKRHRSPSDGHGSRRSKKRRVTDKVDKEEEYNDISQIYQNESTMDSRTSDAVPFSSSPDRESTLNYFNNHNHSHQSKERSPSYSPINHSLPDPGGQNAISHLSYTSEIIQPQSFSKSKKKRSTRRTHFTNKRKKKPSFHTTVTPTEASTVVNHPFNQHHYQHHHFNHTDQGDDVSDGQRSSYDHHHRRHHSPSPLPALDPGTEDSDDDGTEPMKESSEEMLRMLELPDSIINKSSPPYTQLNNRHNHYGSINNNNTTQDNSSEGGIKIKIKLSKPNSDTNQAASPYLNSIVTDLSSPPPQSLLSEGDRRSVSERLQLMRDESPVSVSVMARREDSPFDQSPPEPSGYQQQRYSPPSVSSTHTSSREYRDHHRHRREWHHKPASVLMSPANTPLKLVMKPLELLRHQSMSSPNSSPKTLPALDDCDNRIPPLLFSTSKVSSKKRKRSRLNSSGNTKMSKSKKSSKHRPDVEVAVAPPQRPAVSERKFISVDDVFSEDDENNGSSVLTQQNHQHPHKATPEPAHARLPIPTIKIRQRPRKSSSAATVVPVAVPAVAHVAYNYSCLQGEAHYESEDGKVVYICPVCNTEDNGSLMLQCDRCQDWYHGLCLGIFDPPPETLEWFCPRCREDRLSGRASSATAPARTKAPSSASASKNRTKRK